MSRSATVRWLVATVWQAVLLGFIATLAWLAENRAAAAGPLEPHEALADFQLPPGYRIELVAAEPQVVDPIAIAFDEKGRLWVVEMRDYPTLEPGQRPASRIRVLEDRNPDGRFETATTFADELAFPTGLQPWRGGVIVTLAGEIAYFRDTTGNGRADQRETWYEGFSTGNEQLRASHPRLAADGRVYVTGGLRGGEIRDPRRPEVPPVSIRGRDFAFDPLSGKFEAVSGHGQFGLTFDDFGRRFNCSNRNPLIQIVFEQRYLDRNPKFVLPQIVHDVAAAGADSRLYPRSRALTTSARHAGQFTAACGLEIFGGDALPVEAHGNAFVCEPTGNLVHRQIVSDDRASMTARPVDDGVEFLSATDEWFRPVYLYTGPDGALYVVDMYRAVIEHPEWMPEELRTRSDLRDGKDRGRIYRIVADGPAVRPAGEATTGWKNGGERAARLTHANSWQRDTALRLLLEAEDTSVEADLRQIVAESNSPAGRFQALSALAALGVLDDQTLLAALDDEAAGVREQALVLAESRLAHSPALAAKVLGMADDPNARVRFQVALSLMMLPSEVAVPALVSIARQDAADEWTGRAVALASRDQAAAILSRVLPQADAEESPSAAAGTGEMVRELVGAVVATGDMQQLAGILAQAANMDRATLRTLVLAAADALEQQGDSWSDLFPQLAEHAPRARPAIERLFDDALALIGKETVPESARVEAATLLRLDARPGSVEPLLSIFEQESTPALQIAIVEAFRPHAHGRIVEMLLESFPEQLPSVRRAVLDLLIERREWAIALLEAAADEQIEIAGIDPSRREKLRQHPDAAVRERAEELLAIGSGDREEVLARYRAALDLVGNPARGKQVFATACASCHRLGGEGVAIGPDIGDSELKVSAQLLTDILDPNRAIDADYISYTAITLSGRVYQGIIRAETNSAIALLTADGRTMTILRSELESLTAGTSLMPDGLEQQISVEQMADLLSYLKTWQHTIAENADQPAGQTPESASLAPSATSSQ